MHSSAPPRNLPDIMKTPINFAQSTRQETRNCEKLIHFHQLRCKIFTIRRPQPSNLGCKHRNSTLLVHWASECRFSQLSMLGAINFPHFYARSDSNSRNWLATLCKSKAIPEISPLYPANPSPSACLQISTFTQKASKQLEIFRTNKKQKKLGASKKTGHIYSVILTHDVSDCYSPKKT